MRINNNIMAMNAHRQLAINQSNASKSMERLSSGMRINRAGDDAAGLAISEKMRAQVRGLKQASRNAQDGISLIQTAEGALNETHAILQRMRELAVQSATDTNTDIDRKEIQNEISQLKEELDRIANTTEFNTQKLLDGSKGARTTSADLTAGHALEASATNPVRFHDGAEDKNNTIGVTIERGSDVYHLVLELDEGDYDDLVSFAKAFNSALTKAAGDLGAMTGVDIADIVGHFSLGFDVNPEDGKVMFQLRAASGEAVDGVKFTVNAGTNDTLDRVLGINGSDVSVIGNADNAVSADFNALSKDVSEADVQWDQFSVRLEDGLNGEVHKNNELQMIIDDLQITAEITKGKYDSNEDLAAEVKAGIEAAIDEAVDALTVEELEAKGYKGKEGDMKTAYKADLKSGLTVEFNSENKLEISGNYLMEVDESSSAAQILGLTDINTDIKNSGITFQIGANSSQTMTIAINDMRTTALGDGQLTDIDLSTREGAEIAVDVIDRAIEQVSTERSKLGAYQNRLEHTITNLGTSAENLQAAESRIRDLDMAEEIMAFTKNNILQQAATAMLAQANMAPQSVLQLLG
jgi:flagellin